MSQLALISCCHIVALSDVNSNSYKSTVFFVERHINAKYCKGAYYLCKSYLCCNNVNYFQIVSVHYGDFVTIHCEVTIEKKKCSEQGLPSLFMHLITNDDAVIMGVWGLHLNQNYNVM